MELSSEAQITLQGAGYDTWLWVNGPKTIVCFEDDAIAGFIHNFSDAAALLEEWQSAQQAALARYAPALMSAGDKAWNIYSIFVTAARAPSPAIDREVERIDEIFQHTRKIARTSVISEQDLRNALLPLLPVTTRPSIGPADYKNRLARRIGDLPPPAVAGFLSDASAVDIAVMLGDPS